MSLRETAEQAMMATPHKQLIDELLDSRIPKSEREHAAAREIERLRQELVKPEQEPVAYVTGYFDGKCVISSIEHYVFPIGLALYLSPPPKQQFRQVEPVLYLNGKPLFDVPPPLMPLQWNKAPVKTEWGEDMVEALVEIDKDHTLKMYCEADQAARVEAMIGAHKPLSDEEIKAMWVAVDHRKIHQVIAFVRAIEQAHGIRGE